MVHLTVALTRVEGQHPPYDHNFRLGSAVYNLLDDHSKEAAAILHDAPAVIASRACAGKD